MFEVSIPIPAMGLIDVLASCISINNRWIPPILSSASLLIMSLFSIWEAENDLLVFWTLFANSSNVILDVKFAFN